MIGRDGAWREWFKQYGEDQPKAFGWPEEGSRNIGSMEEVYRAFRGRLLDELFTITYDGQHRLSYHTRNDEEFPL